MSVGRIHASTCRSRVSTVRVVANGIKKVDIKKQGMSSIEEGVLKQNLQGTSRFMKKKDWKDASGSKGKVRVEALSSTSSAHNSTAEIGKLSQTESSDTQQDHSSSLVYLGNTNAFNSPSPFWQDSSVVWYTQQSSCRSLSCSPIVTELYIHLTRQPTVGHDNSDSSLGHIIYTC